MEHIKSGLELFLV